MANTSTVTQTTSSAPKIHTVKAVALSTYLKRHFRDDTMALATATGIKPYQIRKWLNNNAVLADGKVYLKASKIDETAEQTRSRLKALSTTRGVEGEAFNDMLSRDFGGNQSQFAKHYGVHQQQVNRWTKRDCLFIEEQVYRMQRPLFEDAAEAPAKH